MDKQISLKTSFAEVFLSSDWSSSVADHRKEIRLELYKKSRDAKVLDLNQVPQFDDFFVSISHCKSLGGYALNLKEPIGFDVEQRERISLKSIERISSEQERGLADEDFQKLLWPIKEATFKRFQGEVGLITEAEVKSVKSIAHQTYEGLIKVREQSLKFLAGPVGKDCVFALVKSQ